jgi:hypothetical protein
LDIFVHIVLIAIIIYSIWLIRTSWSKPFKKEVAENVARKKDYPSHILFPSFRNPQNTVSYMKVFSIVLFVISLASEIVMIIA